MFFTIPFFFKIVKVFLISYPNFLTNSTFLCIKSYYMTYSIQDVINKIPQDSLNIFKNIFPPAIYNQILNYFRTKRKTCIRVNYLKTDKSYVMKILQKESFKFRNSEILKEAFIFSENIDSTLLKHHLTKEGYIYLQNPSSMLSSIILDPQENEKILDIAASPGSKTTHIASLMNNKGLIDAIEPDYIRMQRLQHNANLLGANIINFYQTKGENFLLQEENLYDRVLVDAPCSGEGRFNLYDKNSYSCWKKKYIKKFVNLQTKLLLNGIRLCKKNGIIVYSTCTLNIYENEMIINNILKSKEVIIQEIEPKLKEIECSIKPFLSFENNSFDESISKCLRLVPNDIYEGFFICKLKKRGSLF